MAWTSEGLEDDVSAAGTFFSSLLDSLEVGEVVS
jgi:hypothetical protein